MTIRPVRPEEYDRVADLTVEVYRSLPGGRLSDEYAAILRDVADRAAQADVVVAADDDDKVVGSVTYTLPPSPYAELACEGEAGFRMLVVDPAVQGGGIGEALVRWCLDRARADGAQRVVISTMPWMTAAHRLYERLGFRRTRERDWSPRPGIDCLSYTLDL